jgi:hypothetical protein
MTTQQITINCIIVGIITVAIGIFTEKTLHKYDRKDNFLSRLKKNYALFIICLFLFGCAVHYLFDYIGLEAACERKCENDKCQYQCFVKFHD